MPVPSVHPRRARRVSRAFAGLLASVVLVGVAAAGAPGVAAKDTKTGDELFGTYTSTARANGVMVTYDAENVFPVSPVLQATVPEALATLGSGPTGYALASVAYPGPLVADLGTVVALANEDAPPVPPYPIRQESFHPTGPATASEGGDGGPEMRAATTKSSSSALAHFASTDQEQAITFGDVTSRSVNEVVGGQLVSRARSEVSDVVVLGGVITIESVVTDIVAVHDGKGGATAGKTVVQGLQVLGLDAKLTGAGVELAKAPADEPDDEESPVPVPLEDVEGPLGQVLDPAEQVTEPLNDGLADAQAQARPPIDEALAKAGIEIELLKPDQTLSEGSATRSAGGLSIRFRYEGREQEQMNQLVSSVPPELRASLGPVPNPVNMLVENHIVGYDVAPAFVNASAAPLFIVDIPDFVTPTFPEVTQPPVVPDTPAAPSDPVVTPSLDDEQAFEPSGFDTPLPATSSGGTTGPGSISGPAVAGPSAGPGAQAPQTPPQAITPGVPMETKPIRAILTGAVPAFLALVLAFAAPLFALGSGKLADTALAPAATSCPHGRDVPDAPRE